MNKLLYFMPLWLVCEVWMAGYIVFISADRRLLWKS